MADEDYALKLTIEAEDRTRDAFEQAKKRSEELKKLETELWRQVNDAQKQANTTGKEWEDLRKKAVQTGSQLQQSYNTQAAALRQLVAAHNAAAAAAAKHGHAATSAFGAAGNALLHYGKHFLTIAAVEEGVRRSIEAYSQFERGMARIEMESGATAKQMEHLGHSFEGLARLTGASVEALQGQFRAFRDVAGTSLDTTIHAFDDIVKAAHAAGVSVESMSRIAVSAVKVMEVPFSELKGMLDVITQTVPASMLQAWESVGPKILSTLRSIGTVGKEHVQQAATAFMHLSQVMGSAEQGASVFQQLMSKSMDLGGNFGKVMVPQLIAIDKAGGSANDKFQAIYATMQKLGIDSDDPMKRLFIQQKFGFSEETVRGAREYNARIVEIEDTAKKLGVSFDEVEKRVIRLNRGPMAAVDDLKGAFNDLWTEIGKLLGPSIPETLSHLLTGLKHDIGVVNDGFKALRQNILLTESPEGKPTTRAEETLRRMQEHQARQRGEAPPAAGGKPEMSITDFLFGKPEQRGSWNQILPGNWVGTPQDNAKNAQQQKIDAEIARRKRLRGYATGGSFDIPGQGGSAVDTEPVGFLGKPGERVTVTTPQQESLQLQQDKADQASRDHFARFHSTAFTKTTGAPWWPAGGVRGPGGGGGGGGGAGGGMGQLPGMTGTGTGTGRSSSGDSKDGTPGTDAPGTGSTPLKTPTNLDITSDTGPAQDIETAIKRGYLVAPAAEGGGATYGPQDRNNKSIPASIRYNNPGAQWPDSVGDAKRFGMTDVGVIGGGNKIAGFPTPVHGLASNIALAHRLYVGKTVGNAISKWSNGGRSSVPGYNSGQIFTKEMANDPKFWAAMAKAESGKNNHLSLTQVGQALQMYQSGSAAAFEKANPDFVAASKGKGGTGAVAGTPTVGTASSVAAAVRAGQSFDAAGNVIDAPAGDTGGTGDYKTVIPKGALKGVDPVLVQAVQEGSKFLPEGYKMSPTSGVRGNNPSSQHYSGSASDWQITGPDGKVLPNRGWGPQETELHKKVAQGAYGWLLKNHPEKAKKFEWGGAFETSKGSGSPDLMHYDFGGRRGIYGKNSISNIGPIYPQAKVADNKPAAAPTNTKVATAAPATGQKTAGQKADDQLDKASGKPGGAAAATPVKRMPSPPGQEERAAGKGGGPAAVVTAHPVSPQADPIPGKQWGGSVRGGRPYMVGESGPEMFTPAGPGQVTPGPMDISGMMGQYRQFADMLRAPITPNLQMPRVGPMQRRMSRRVEDQRERDSGRMSRHASHSDIGFS